MVFSVRITTPANTAILTPLDTLLKVSSGLIYQVEIMFPPGPSGLVGVKIMSQNVALYPRNREEWLIGDNYTYRFPDLHELYVDSNILEIFTYNVDTDYEHIIQVTVGIVSREDYIQHFLPGRGIGELNETFQKLIRSVADKIPVYDTELIDIIAGEN